MLAETQITEYATTVTGTVPDSLSRRDVGGEAAMRALVEAGGQSCADGPPASPRPRSIKLSLLQRRQLRMIGQQRSGPARMIVFAGRRLSDVTGTQQVAPASSERRGASEKLEPMQAMLTPMAAAVMKMTMKRHAKAVVGLAQAVVVLVLQTSEVVTSMEPTQSCKDFTRRSHINSTRQ